MGGLWTMAKWFTLGILVGVLTAPRAGKDTRALFGEREEFDRGRYAETPLVGDYSAATGSPT